MSGVRRRFVSGVVVALTTWTMEASRGRPTHLDGGGPPTVFDDEVDLSVATPVVDLLESGSQLQVDGAFECLAKIFARSRDAGLAQAGTDLHERFGSGELHAGTAGMSGTA